MPKICQKLAKDMLKICQSLGQSQSQSQSSVLSGLVQFQRRQGEKFCEIQKTLPIQYKIATCCNLDLDTSYFYIMNESKI